MFKIKPASLILMVLATFSLSIVQANSHLRSLSDEQLSETTGQALMTLSYIAPTDVTNLEATRKGGDKNLGFYKLGLEAELQLNANIRKLQLGCGGVNGAGACDIDMDNVSLSGLKLDANNNPIEMTREERAGSSAVLTNPFMEFAIKNPNSASTREIVGLRLGSEFAKGLLTIGQNDGTVNGINSLSGYMNIASVNGTTKTAIGNLTETITGKANIGGCVSGCPIGYTTNNNPIKINGMDVGFTTVSSDVMGTRMQNATVKAMAKVPDILLDASSGTRSATLNGCFWMIIIPLCDYKINTLTMNGKISNLYTDITLTEALGLIHSIPVQSALSLSLQKTSILWPNAPKSPVTGNYIVANQGWWLAANDPINLGTLKTADNFSADISSAYPKVAETISTYLSDHPLNIPFGDAVGSVFTSALTANIGTVDLNSYTNPAAGGTGIKVSLSNLPLGSAQNVTPNCYGSLKFC